MIAASEFPRFTELFLLNQTKFRIEVELEVELFESGPPLTIWPGRWASREVSRGTKVILATQVLAQQSFDLGVKVFGKGLVERHEFVIPVEAGNSPRWGWDGQAWRRLDGEAIHDFDGALRHRHRPIWPQAIWD